MKDKQKWIGIIGTRK